MDQFENIMKQYAPMISAIIRKLHIYRDFETFRQVGKIALWQAYERFDETKGNFTPFAYRSIYGALLDELKREVRVTGNVMVMENENFEQIEDLGYPDELPEWLDSVLLSIEERNLLEALFVEGRSVVELAALNQLSVAGMKKRRERILKKLKKQLSAGEDF